jgi:hypothetical protein
MKNRPLLNGTAAEKAEFITASQGDITYMNLCQTLKQAHLLCIERHACTTCSQLHYDQFS